nr:immunoglobulin light chain junction region [Macaca mulatta]
DYFFYSYSTSGSYIF